MKIILIQVGKTSTDYIRRGIEEYTGRIGHFIPFEIKTIADVKTTKKSTPDQQKFSEGQQILSLVGNQDYLMLLDERGKQYTSREFSTFITDKSLALPRNLIFVIGGPYGFSQEVYSRADSMLSLSKMTFPHELIRLFFVEQLYRAMTIARNLPYHHD